MAQGTCRHPYRSAWCFGSLKEGLRWTCDDRTRWKRRAWCANVATPESWGPAKPARRMWSIVTSSVQPPTTSSFSTLKVSQLSSIWTRSLLSLAPKRNATSQKNAYLIFFAPTTEHENYLVGLDESKEPGILSVETTSSKRVGKQFVYRALLRTARVPRPRFDSPCVRRVSCVVCVLSAWMVQGDERFLVQGSKNGKKKPKVSHIRRSHDALKRENVPLVPVSDKAIADDLAHFEDRSVPPPQHHVVARACPTQQAPTLIAHAVSFRSDRMLWRPIAGCGTSGSRLVYFTPGLDRPPRTRSTAMVRCFAFCCNNLFGRPLLQCSLFQ
jgi:hypothetical protein